MHFLTLFSCSKCGLTAGGKKKVPTSFPKIFKIDKITFFLAFYFIFGILFFFWEFISFLGFYFIFGILFHFWDFIFFWGFYFFGGILFFLGILCFFGILFLFFDFFC